MDMLGRARQVKVDKENTTIVEGAGDRGSIAARVASDPQPDRRDHLRLRPREAAGASGQAGRRRGRHPGRRCDRGRDEGAQAAHRGRSGRDPRRCGRGHRARRRHRAAQRACPTCRPCWPKYAGDAKTGVQIVLRALEEPVRQIAANAGHGRLRDRGEDQEQPPRSPATATTRCNDEYVRHDRAPASSTRPRSPARALQNAASVAAMVLTTESLVADIPAPEPAAPAGGCRGMGGMY